MGNQPWGAEVDLCPVCGNIMDEDVDMERDDEGHTVTSVTAYCPDERWCEATACEMPTHEVCADCGMAVCDDHTDPYAHDCPGLTEEAITRRGLN